MNREVKILQLKDTIEKLGSDFNGLLNDLESIPKINLLQYPLINTFIKNLKLRVFNFSEVFNGKDMETFDPTELTIKKEIKKEIVNEPAFLFKNKYSREFLVYCGDRLIPQYIWELITTEIEEETPESSDGSGNSGDEESGGDDDLSFDE